MKGEREERLKSLNSLIVIGLRMSIPWWHSQKRARKGERKMKRRGRKKRILYSLLSLREFGDKMQTGRVIDRSRNSLAGGGKEGEGGEGVKKKEKRERKDRLSLLSSYSAPVICLSLFGCTERASRGEDRGKEGNRGTRKKRGGGGGRGGGERILL